RSVQETSGARPAQRRRHLSESLHQMGVVQGHPPPANPAENHIPRGEVVVRAHIELVKSCEARGAWNLSPKVAGLQTGRTEIGQREQSILNALRNTADTVGWDHIIGERKAR